MLKRFLSVCYITMGLILVQTKLSGPVGAQTLSADDLLAGKKATDVQDLVGSGGEFRYSFPFDLPEFRNLEPDLGLVYNSSNRTRGGPENFVAYGWSLAGLSKIERKSVGGGVPSFDDGQDIYVLDGQELLVCSETGVQNKWTRQYPMTHKTDLPSASCSSGGNFTSQVENYERIQYVAASNQFIVTRTNGVRYVFESVGALVGVVNATGSLDEIANRSRWLLTEISDTQQSANKVQINYGFASSEMGYAEHPNEIVYANYRVAFGYKLNNGPNIEFGTGTEILGKQPWRLDYVAITNGSQKIRAYRLLSGENSTAALTRTVVLKGVETYGKDFGISTAGVWTGTKLPSTSFEYTPDSYSLYSQEYTGKEFHRGYLPSDWNRDGRDDITLFGGGLYSGLDPAYNLYHTLQSKRYFIESNRALVEDTLAVQNPCPNPYDPDEQVPAPLGRNSGVAPNTLQNDRSSLAQYCINVDFTDDGGKKTVHSTYRMDVNPPQLVQTRTHAPGYHIPILGNFDLDADSEFILHQGLFDVNDGIQSWTSSVSDANSNLTPGADFTGDGVSDFYYSSRSGSNFRDYHFYRLNFENTPTAPGTHPNRSFQHVSSYKMNRSGDVGIGDINGDGLNDLFHFDSNYSDDVAAQYNSGGDFISESFYFLPSSFGEGAKVEVQDLNTDGLADLILHQYTQTSSTSQIAYPSAEAQIYINTGANGSARFSRVQVSGSDTFYGFLGIGDFDGNGLPDILIEGASGKILFNLGSPPNVMTTVKTPDGGATKITYGVSSESISNGQMPTVQRVVSKIEYFDGRESSAALSYSYDYEGGQYDFIHRRTLGYNKVTTHLSAINGESVAPTTVTTYLNGNIAEYGRVRSRVTAVEAAGTTTIFALEINEWDINFVGNGPYRAQKVSERVATRYGPTLFETKRAFVHDLYGRPIRVIDYGATPVGVDEAFDDNTTTIINYALNLSDYIVDRPSVKRLVRGVTDSVNQLTWLTAEYYYYDGATAYTVAPSVGNLTAVRKWDGVPNSGISRKLQAFTYDIYGNVLTEADARGIAAATPYVSATHVYDSTMHLFRVSSTNAVGHVTQTAWDTDCQKPATVTDPNLSVTSYEYDAVCRETRQTQPNGSYKTTSYVNLGSPAAQYILTKSPKSSSTASTSAAEERQYFDGLGRAYKSARSGSSYAGSDLIVTLTGYDARGNVGWQSNPKLWGAAGVNAVSDAEKTKFSYDPLDRPLKTTFPDGEVETKTYASLDMIIYGSSIAYPGVISRNADCGATDTQPPCIEVQEYFDHANRKILERRTDSIPTDSSPPSSSYRDTRYSYDLLGRLTDINNMGILWDYTYDGFGNRLTALDPGLSPATAAGAGTPWRMVYDVNGNLTRQTDAKGQVITFAYDRLNRVTTKSVTANGTTKTTTSTYDEITGRSSSLNKGRLTTLTTTGGHSIEYDYDRMGQVKFQRQTIDGTRTFALSTDYGDHGEVLRYYLPNTPGSQAGAFTATMAYDAAGRLSSWPALISSIAYDARSNPTAIAYANGASDSYIYSAPRGWVKEIHSYDSGATPTWIARTLLAYTGAGRIYIHNKSASGIASSGAYYYTYDYAGRLKKVLLDNAVLQQAFVYDAKGRMTTNTDLGTYVYTTNKPAQAPASITSVAGVTTTLTYDANGNMLTGIEGKVMAYDGENRPLSVFKAGKCTAYVYGADGTRLKKIEVATATAAACNGVTAATPGANVTVTFGLQEFRNYGQGTAEEILSYPLPNIRFTATAANRTHSVLHRDHQGSVLAITNSAGVKVQTSLYTPFGKQTNWVAVPTAEPETKGYIGERYDADAGLQYLNARYYDPKLAMFSQPDWWEVMQPGVGVNRYAYAGNDPINGMDPGGNCFWDICVGEALVAIGAAIASAFAADAAIDISNGGAVGDSPLGNPAAQMTSMAIQGGSAVVGMVTGNGDDPTDSSRLGIGGNGGPEMEPEGPELDEVAKTLTVITADRMAHILRGEGSNRGGHLSGTGTPGKTEFPESWGESEIRNAIEQVVQSGQVVSPAKTSGSIVKEGVVDQVTVRVVVNPTNGYVTTAFPTKGPGVVQNPW